MEIKFQTTVEASGLEETSLDEKFALLDLVIGRMNKSETAAWFHKSKYKTALSNVASKVFSDD